MDRKETCTTSSMCVCVCGCCGLLPKSHQCLRHMHVHLVAVEIRIVRCAHARVETESAPRTDADTVAPERERVSKREKV
jgi:hypothetical protein